MAKPSGGAMAAKGPVRQPLGSLKAANIRTNTPGAADAEIAGWRSKAWLPDRSFRVAASGKSSDRIRPRLRAADLLGSD